VKRRNSQDSLGTRAGMGPTAAYRSVAVVPRSFPKELLILSRCSTTDPESPTCSERAVSYLQEGIFTLHMSASESDQG
jgi:hypothetical protein